MPARKGFLEARLLTVVAPDKNKAFKIEVNTLDILDEYKTGDGPDRIGISKDDKISRGQIFC